MFLAFLALCIAMFLNDKNKKNLYQFTYFLVPMFLAVGINQFFLSDKGEEVVEAKEVRAPVLTMMNTSFKTIKFF